MSIAAGWEGPEQLRKQLECAHAEVAVQMKRVQEAERQLYVWQREAKGLRGKCERLEADANRYRYFRANYDWRRFDGDDPGDEHAFIGVRFPYRANFSCAAMLDYNIDKALADPDEMTKEAR